MNSYSNMTDDELEVYAYAQSYRLSQEAVLEIVERWVRVLNQLEAQACEDNA